MVNRRTLAYRMLWEPALAMGFQSQSPCTLAPSGLDWEGKRFLRGRKLRAGARRALPEGCAALPPAHTPCNTTAGVLVFRFAMRPTGAACAAALSFGAIRQAADQIRGSVHRTPVLRSGTLDALLGCELYFKAENLQRTGSFKARGALNAVLQQPAGAPGVVCHSAGNHGQALAWAAAQRGLPCVVVVPDTTPKCKRDAIVAYGAELVTCDPARRLETMTRIAEATGLVPVPPYDDYHVMAGQVQSSCHALHRSIDGADPTIQQIGANGWGMGPDLGGGGGLLMRPPPGPAQ